jgi:DNA-binding NtrC family response regulator
MAKVLIVDDEGKMRALIAMACDGEGHSVEEAATAEDALARLASFAPEVMVTDVRMPGMSGIDLVRQARARRPSMECIVMTAFANAKSGIEAMRAGAFEYVTKPFEMDEMLLLIKSAADKAALAQEVTHLRGESSGRWDLDRIIARSASMQKAIEQARIVAPRDTTVLIRGKSGTGKELIARGIHAAGGRRTFVAINCAALTETLLESELFGHEKGSFTGAHARKAGLFERAGDGSVFLDEIGDISLALQVKLLRVLQEREFTRVGGTEALRTQARVIAATNRDLEAAVKAGAFREDLYYRLNVFPVNVPPLAERADDVPALIDAFLLKFGHTAGMSGGARARLIAYPWPGNVRELENCVERAVIVAGGRTIDETHLPEYAAASVLVPAGGFALPAGGISLDAVEKDFILQALSRAQGNKTKAARLLGISRRALYSRMNTHGIPVSADEAEEKSG